jgi:hypothetical protein
MVAAIKIKAELSGLLNDAPKPQPLPPELMTNRATAEAVLDLLFSTPEVHRVFRERVREEILRGFRCSRLQSQWRRSG